MKSQEEQHVRAQVDEVRGKLQGLQDDLRVVDDKVEDLAPQREQHALLAQACGSLEKLDELGVANLFWGDEIDPARIDARLREVRGLVNEFQVRLDELERQRNEILAAIGSQEQNLEILGEDLYDIQQEEERRKLEWIVEREISAVPPRVQKMAWTRGGEDDKRYYKSLAASLLISLLLGLLLPFIPLPVAKRFVPEDMPRRLAQLVRPEKLNPAPPPKVQETPQEQEPEQAEAKPKDEPKPAEQPPEVAAAEPVPSEKPGAPGPEGGGGSKNAVAKAGILAFKDEFASLADDKLPKRLGNSGRLGNAEESSRASMPTRSMLTSNAPGSSGGINIGSISRNVGGNGGGGGAGGMRGVQIGRAESGIAGIGGGGRPMGGGGGGGGGGMASRTDEEIQIVFDRYKASFYRLYNRELRNDPTLRGQLVLRLTIEPDGSVSMCKLESSDMNAPDLATQVVQRVLGINFGAKDVEALTIVYPIDFLPKA